MTSEYLSTNILMVQQQQFFRSPSVFKLGSFLPTFFYSMTKYNKIVWALRQQFGINITILFHIFKLKLYNDSIIAQQQQMDSNRIWQQKLWISVECCHNWTVTSTAHGENNAASELGERSSVHFNTGFVLNLENIKPALPRRDHKHNRNVYWTLWHPCNCI